MRLTAAFQAFTVTQAGPRASYNYSSKLWDVFVTAALTRTFEGWNIYLKLPGDEMKSSHCSGICQNRQTFHCRSAWHIFTCCRIFLVFLLLFSTVSASAQIFHLLRKLQNHGTCVNLNLTFQPQLPQNWVQASHHCTCRDRKLSKCQAVGLFQVFCHSRLV